MIITFYTPIKRMSGGNIVMKRYAEFLAKHGHSVYIIAGAKENKEFIENGVNYRYFNKYLNNYIGNFLYLIPYIKNYIELTPSSDVIIPVFFPLVVHAVLAKKQKKTKKVISLFQEHIGMWYFWGYICALLRIKFFMNEIDEIISVSEPTAKEVQQVSGRMPVIVKNSIEKEYYFKRDVEKEDYILFVGSGPDKGLPVFLKSINKVLKTYPDLKIKIVGTKKQSDNPNIEYIGYTNDKNYLAELYSKALIYVNQSPGDSFGLPSLEAMACGTAVILTDTIGSKDYAKNNFNAVVVPPKNAKATENAVISLLRDDKLRHQLEEKGIETVKNYDWNTSCNKLLQILERETEG